MNVLLTGASGFVGQNILPYLSKKFNVHPTSRKIDNYDLLDENSVMDMMREYDPDVVVHCAGVVGGIGANKARPGEFFYENMKMSMNLIHMSRHCKKFVMLGTVCSYPKFTPTPFKEESLWHGYPEETNAPYGVAKRALMEMLSAYNKSYGLQYTVLIPTNMYGPYDNFDLDTSHVIPALIRKIDEAKKTGELEIWGTGTPSREFLYGADIAYAIESAIHTDYNGCINIGTGIETKISDLVETLTGIMGYNGIVRYNQNYPDGQPRRCLNVERAKNVLNFSAKTRLEDGLRKTVEWYNAYLRNNY